MARAGDLWSRMDTGQKVSGLAHIGLIVWVMVFDLFQAPDAVPRVPVSDVSLISAEEFAALSSPGAPVPAPPAPDPEPAPEPEIAAPEPVRPDPEPAAPAPDPEPAPAPEPEPVQPAPAPEPEPQPEPEAPAPEAPSTGVIFSPAPTPGASSRPRPRPVDRVAPTPSEAPPDSAQIDLAAQPPAQPEEPAEEAPVVEPEQAETAPPEATTEIVTEATETDDAPTERAAAAPNISQRPRTRPERPTPPPATETATETPAEAPRETVQAREPDPEPATPPSDAIEQALADALADTLAQEFGSGSTPSASAALSSSEADALRLAIQQCWNVGVLSTDAQQVTVTVGFSMTPAARHEQGSIRIVAASGGTETAIQQAFDAARRAIIRCEGDGYGLPPEKYDAWRDIEITFNPEGMRLR